MRGTGLLDEYLRRWCHIKQHQSKSKDYKKTGLSIKQIMHKKLTQYILIGAVGFSIDFISYLTLLDFGLSVYLSRGLAFFFAGQATYVLNACWTFADKQGNRKHYFIGQSCGIAVNYLFFLLSYQYVFIGDSILAFCLGSATALVFNFLVANCWSFKTEPNRNTKRNHNRSYPPLESMD